jgi:general secretion pathway protein D
MKRLSMQAGTVLAALILTVMPLGQARGQNALPSFTPAVATMPAEDQLARVEFRNVPLADALRLLAGVSGDNIVASTEASKTHVSLLLRNVPVLTAIDELCKTNDLYQQRDPQTGITRILTTQEFQRQLGDSREQKTQVFTLLYPNALDVAVAIRDLYGDRVQLSLGVPQELDTRDIQERFNRFDLVDQRSQIQGLTSNGSTGPNGTNNNTANGNNYTSTSSAQRYGNTSIVGDSLSSLAQPAPTRGGEVAPGKTPPDLAALRSIEEATTPEERAAAIDRYLSASNRGVSNRKTDIFVTVARRNNLVIVRTSDQNTLAQVGKLVQKMDVPTPLVLLEVKVLSIDLTDGFSSAFDWQFTDRLNWAGGFSSGNIQAPLSDALPPSGQIPIGIGGTGVKPNALSFQFVSSNFRARLQLLEDKNRVTSLAAPLLLTANNEVSRLFVGQNYPVVTNVASQTVVNNNNTITTPTTQFQFQPVGTTLLLTPNINSDRTVTLRILQETSSVKVGGANIPFVGANGSVTNFAVDVVQSRAVSGTVVGKDGLMVAIGGLIQEQVNDTRQEVPILGRIPLLGLLFRDQNTGRSRSEMIILIRPFVLSTPAESQQISKKLTEELSINPKIQDPSGTLNTFQPDEVLHPDLPKNKLQEIFQFHSVAPADY